MVSMVFCVLDQRRPLPCSWRIQTLTEGMRGYD